MKEDLWWFAWTWSDVVRRIDRRRLANATYDDARRLLWPPRRYTKQKPGKCYKFQQPSIQDSPAVSITVTPRSCLVSLDWTAYTTICRLHPCGVCTTTTINNMIQHWNHGTRNEVKEPTFDQRHNSVKSIGLINGQRFQTCSFQRNRKPNLVNCYGRRPRTKDRPASCRVVFNECSSKRKRVGYFNMQSGSWMALLQEMRKSTDALKKEGNS